MPQVQLIPGATVKLGAGQVTDRLTIATPFGSTFTISIGSSAPVSHVLDAAGVIAIPVNGAAVSVTKNRAGVSYPPENNLTLNW